MGASLEGCDCRGRSLRPRQRHRKRPVLPVLPVLLALMLAAGCQKVHERAATAAAQDGTALAPDRLAVLRGGRDDAGFARALGPRIFEFPRDHGPHPQFRYEWWYFTGRLHLIPGRGGAARGGAEFGFELTFFRVGVAPPDAAAVAGSSAAAATAPSRWRTRQVYAAHFAVTDIGARTFHSQVRYAREALGLAGAQALPLHVWVEDWSLTQSSATMRLQAADAQYQLDLQARPEGPPVLNGQGGLSRKGDAPGQASYYYSIPRLATQGTLTVGGRALAVSGTTWLDREWGSGALAASQEGWDWFSLQLSDGSAFMFYALRDHGAVRDIHSAGTWVNSAGQVLPLHSADVSIGVERYWTGARGARYPAAWSVRVGSTGLALEIRPVLADQELRTEPPYWEGAVDAHGTLRGKPVSAQGYVELVGYAR